MARKQGFEIGLKKVYLHTHLFDVYNAAKILLQRPDGFSIRPSINQVVAYIDNFSSFDGSKDYFLKLYLIAESALIKQAKEKEEKNER